MKIPNVTILDERREYDEHGEVVAVVYVLTTTAITKPLTLRSDA